MATAIAKTSGKVTTKDPVDVVEVKGIQETTKNVYKVPASAWRKWSLQARYTYNFVRSSMQMNQEFFVHPKTKKLPADQWNTTCHNAAWYAADGADGADGYGKQEL